MKKKKELKQEKKNKWNTKQYLDLLLWATIIIILTTYATKAIQMNEIKQNIQELKELGMINTDGTPNCKAFETYKPIQNNKMYQEGVRICHEKQTSIYQQKNS